MKQQLDQYLEAIRNDYRKWKGDVNSSDLIQNEIRKQMTKEFCDSLRYEDGRKYIKVIQNNSVHSFIAKSDDGKFKCGDILKAASWATPAKNFARGNILNGEYNIRWTGA